MKLKKLLSLGMAAVMTAALAVPAFATNNEVEIVASYQAITIDVSVPSDTTAKINPFGLPLKFTKATSGAGDVTISGQQIVTNPSVALKNKMGVDLKVSVTATGAVTALPASSTATPMRLATEALTADVTAKSAFVYVQAKAGTYVGTDETSDADTITDKIIDDYAAWAVSSYNEASDLLVKAGTTTLENMITLKAATMYGSSDSDATHPAGSFKSFAAGSIGLFRVTGQVVTSPKEAWSTDDGFTVTLAYTFIPA